MPDFLVFYNCRTNQGDGLPIIRAVVETDPINAIITARREERDRLGFNCADCILAAVKLAS